MKLFLRSFSSLPLIYSRRVVVSYKRKYVHELLVNGLFKHVQEKSVVRSTDSPTMTIAVDLGRKATKTNKQNGKVEQQLEQRQPMVQTRGLFCMCDSGVALCQS